MPVMITHDTSIDYDVHGDGPALLLIGGLGFGRWGWFKQIPTLSRHFRTISFDTRGEQSLSRGVADLSAEVIALLDHLGLAKAHVVGTSLGGFVAQELALERPDLVDRLVLVCTSYGGVGPELMSPQALGQMLGWGSLSPESAARRGLEGATTGSYRAEHPEEFDLILRWRLADSSSLYDYYQQMMAGVRFDASHKVANIAAPTLVIHGAEDRYVPVANAAALAEAIPDAELRILDGAGHLVFIERAEEVNEEILSFLEPRQRKLPLGFPDKQKAKQLLGRVRKTGERLVPFGLRHSQEPDGTREAQAAPETPEKEHPALERLKGWFRRPLRATVARVRELRDRLFR